MNNNNFTTDNLTKQGINQLSQDIIQDTDSLTNDQLVRYAIIRSTEQAYADAKASITPEVIRQAAAEHPEAGAGKMFVHQGLRFLIQLTPVYDFTGKRDWQAVKRRLDQQQKELDAIKAELKAVESRLILTGKIQPNDIKQSIRFLPK